MDNYSTLLIDECPPDLKVRLVSTMNSNSKNRLLSHYIIVVFAEITLFIEY